MLYLSNFWKFLTFSMLSNQSTKKMVANDGQITGNAIRFLMWGVEVDVGSA